MAMSMNPGRGEITGARVKCGEETQIFSRVCGYHRPVRNWNKGKQSEFYDRKTFNVNSSMARQEAREKQAVAN